MMQVMWKIMINVKGWGVFLDDMRCLCTTFWRLKYLMFGRSTSWGHSLFQMEISTFLWWWTMHQSGLRYYASKWVEGVVFSTNDAKVVSKFPKKHIFTRFWTPRAIISDVGTQFMNQLVKNILAKFGVRHKVATTHHPQTSGQIGKWTTFYRKRWMPNERIGKWSLMMHYGRIGPLITHQ